MNAIAVSGNKAYLGGTFTQIGYACGTGALFDTTSGALLSWDPKAENEITASTQVGSVVYVGGYFVSMGRKTRFDTRAELKEEPLWS